MVDRTKSSYLEYLPGIYEDPRYDFLGRFLAPFEGVVRGFEDVLAGIDRVFATTLTDPEVLPWLATWVALVLDEEWDERKRRGLIAEAVELYRWRGTVQGLLRYLEIYTGLLPEIREGVWPGGMQIGVASQIGGTAYPPPKPGTPPDPLTPITKMQREEPDYHDYYVVKETDKHLSYRTDQVKRVEIGEKYVEITRLDNTVDRHEPATVTRRDGLVEDVYTLTTEDASGPEDSVEYRGNSILVDEQELPYRFILNVRVPAADIDKVKLEKVRAIVDLEKPAHTAYYLKMTPVISVYVLQTMQLDVRSTIGADAIVG